MLRIKENELATDFFDFNATAIAGETRDSMRYQFQIVMLIWTYPQIIGNFELRIAFSQRQADCNNILWIIYLS